MAGGGTKCTNYIYGNDRSNSGLLTDEVDGLVEVLPEVLVPGVHGGQRLVADAGVLVVAGHVLGVPGVADVKEGKDLGCLGLLNGGLITRGGRNAAHAHADTHAHAVVVGVVGGHKVRVHHFILGAHEGILAQLGVGALEGLEAACGRKREKKNNVRDTALRPYVITGLKS
ncbi:hypothetical protein E2C01_020170 [Portunus trituberculatus]|uniref:Uncharacterized protein n=1 Tax=Portunus trituberculatus TaxID=210409 RepID=A0A5B7DZU2_PORTR|nr:hypothetical protein [Portunus trituberculatus]